MDDYTLTLSDDGKILKEFSRVVSNGFSVTVNIPRYVEIPKSVIKIEENAFKDASTIEYINVPDTIEIIGDGAFDGCSRLEKFYIPSSLKKIGKWVFDGCSSLKKISVIDNNNFEDEDGILFDKEKKTIICFPAGKKDETYSIPKSVSIIAEYAFSGCKSLKSIDIPNSIRKISNCAFLGCSSLNSVDLPNSITEIGNWAFVDCTSLKSIDIPKSVTRIGKFALCGCSSLKTIYLPVDMAEIGEGSFANCQNLDKIIVDSMNANFCTENHILYNKNKESILCYPSGKTESSFNIPSSVKEVGNCAFSCCSSLKSIIIPNSVSVIGQYAFENCNSIKSIKIPNSVSKIGKGAFGGCLELIEIHFYETNPDNIEIEESAFSEEQFKSVILFIPNGTRRDYRHHKIFSKFNNIEIEFNPI